ncbi:hypothetical protein [Luteimicrobium sp. DT211]|uniref:hypothetical protein n=1 Tax=Luteimicrobium sp. DT211 TaxID=3393412 RepID=UPI003CEBCEA8
MSDRQYGEIEGDPGTLAKKATRYQEIADAIQRSTRTLDKIADQVEQKSLAMEKTRSLARDVSKDISKALDRYRTTGDALAKYEKVLSQARADGNPQVARIAALHAALSAARSSEFHAQQNADSTASASSSHPDDVADAKRIAHRATQERQDVEDELAAAQKIWDDAEASKNVAAEAARSAIVEVVSGSRVHGLKDSRWDKFTFYLGKAYEVFKVVCDIAGVLSIFLGWVPFLGQALIVLAAVGAVLSVVEAAVNVATGKGSWGDLFLAAGMAALTIFGGKLLALGADAVKGRAVLTLAERVGPTAARETAGVGSELTAAYRTMGQSTGQRLLGMLKSPWVRSTAQREMFRDFQTSADKLPAFGRILKQSATEAFPANPFKGGAERWLFQNESVEKLGKLAADHPNLFTDGMHAQTALLQLGAHANAVFSLGRAGVGVYQAATGSDAFGTVTGSAAIGTRPMEGSFGDMVSGLGSIKDLADTIDEMV